MENNIPDIDKFFRENLVGHESNYVPGAWESMETMLNQGDKGFLAKNVKNYLLASVVGAIVLGGSLVAYISGADKQAAQQKVEPTKSTPKNQPTAVAEQAGLALFSTDVISDENTNNTINTNINNTTGTPNSPTKKGLNTQASKLPIISLEDTDNNLAIDDQTTQKAIGTYTKNLYSFDAIPAAKTAVFETPSINPDITDTRGKIDSAQQIMRQLNAMRSHYRSKFGIVVGANFNSIMSNTPANNQFGSGIMAGVHYSKNFGSRFGIMAEIAYLRRTGHNLTRTINQTRYFLEKTTVDYFLVTKTTDHIQLPIMARYNFTSRHSFNAGLVATYMIDSRTEVSTRSEEPGEKNSVTETKRGVYEDMNPFGFGISAGYEFKLPGLYSIGLRYNQQLNDITKNSFFNDGKKHLPTDVQLYIKLNLTK